MNVCALCRSETAAGELARVSGLDFCRACQVADPAERLAARDVAVEWNTRLMRFHAGVGIADQDPGLYLKCVPRLWYHGLWTLLVGEVKVGDPTFDARIYVRSNRPDQARELLSSEGVQSAVLALLSGVRVNELVGNHVTLHGPTLLVGMRPLGGLSEEKIRALQLETTALALHLRFRGGAVRQEDAVG